MIIFIDKDAEQWCHICKGEFKDTDKVALFVPMGNQPYVVHFECGARIHNKK